MYTVIIGKHNIHIKGMMRAREITEKQKRVIDIVRCFMSDNGYSPTMREIADELGITVGALYQKLLSLKKKEAINWEEGKSRTIRVLN